ncbi:class I SAM-dependent methyltransferase [Priestia abyssalis]|uniref:class I SAM-dependent methyltransferase n=1 Tax=Priestia abyssalis TaxID=1221450 RepID=UPI00099587E1|nr:class I SAM-dependent methyltransferase [Priestia abyssalis]
MIEYTGERVIPHLMKPTNGLLLEHIARYQFAILYTKGRVLDIACGSGFGSQLVAKAAKKKIDEIIGVDIDPAIIQYAQGTHYHPKVTFCEGNAADPSLPEKLGTFDCIMSFETLEHIKEEEQFLTNLYKMLKPGGTLVISTPFGLGRGKPSSEPFHVHQLTLDEFQDLFHDYSEAEFFYQRGVLVETKREGMHYPLGIAVCIK